MIRVLLADDHQLIRAGFRMVLEGAPDISVVAEAADGAQAVRLAQECSPDVILMDVRMPVMDGVEATRRITTVTPCRVLVLTTFDLDEYAYEALRNGASGFLLKDVLPQTLYDAIRAVAGGDAVLTPRITRELIDRHALSSPAVPVAGGRPPELERLTQREAEVLDLVVSGLTNGQIAQRLVLSEATVKSHVTRILAKLGLHDRVQAVIYAYENGLR